MGRGGNATKQKISVEEGSKSRMEKLEEEGTERVCVCVKERERKKSTTGYVANMVL